MNAPYYDPNQQGQGVSHSPYGYLQQRDPRYPPQLQAAAPELFPPQKTNFWLRIASGIGHMPQRTIEDRERIRRNRLAAWILLGLFAIVLLLIPTTIGSPSSAVALAVAGGGFIVAMIFNRVGWTTAAGVLLIVLISAAILTSVVPEPGGLEVVDLPVYDLMAISVIVGVAILPRGAAFIIAAINIVLIVADFLLQPVSPGLIQVTNSLGAASILARPIALGVIIATVAFLLVRGIDSQVHRADRAEEMASLEHAYAEQRRQLEIGVQQILQTHVRIANGDFKAKAPLAQDNVLWQIGQSLNNLISRIEADRSRANRAEYALSRTNDEVTRFALALRDAQVGRRPLWPKPTGTIVDQLIQIVQSQPAQFPRDSPQMSGAAGWSPTSQPLDTNQSPAAMPFTPQLPRFGARPNLQAPSSVDHQDHNPPSGAPGQHGGFWSNFPNMPPETGSLPQATPRPPTFEQEWPSLDGTNPFAESDYPHTGNGQEQGSDSFPPADVNPWYIPPDGD